MNEIDGDLVKLALDGHFQVVAHGANCFCKMKRGLAPQMDAAFDCAHYALEAPKYAGDINKLGQIDYEERKTSELHSGPFHDVFVVNAYTQFHWDTNTKPLDYEALRLCLRKMNYIFKGQVIGLPEIGCHLAGGDWNIVRGMIEQELKDMFVTIVHYKP